MSFYCKTSGSLVRIRYMYVVISELCCYFRIHNAIREVYNQAHFKITFSIFRKTLCWGHTCMLKLARTISFLLHMNSMQWKPGQVLYICVTLGTGSGVIYLYSPRDWGGYYLPV